MLPGVCCGMSYHDISVDGDGQDVEDGHSQQPVSQQGVQLQLGGKVYKILLTVFLFRDLQLS
jgi:hypothetical protein